MGLSQEPLVTEKMMARQPPQGQALIRVLLKKIAELEARIGRIPHHASLRPNSQRPAAAWRRMMFGTDSARGRRFMKTILTVVETCHPQPRNGFYHIIAAVQAHFAGQPIA